MLISIQFKHDDDLLAIQPGIPKMGRITVALGGGLAAPLGDLGCAVVTLGRA